MSKLILYIPLSLLLLLSHYHSTKVIVITKATAIKIKPGYALTADDSIFNYRGNKYFIVTNETFDENGKLVRASAAGDVGYSTYTQQDFNKVQNLISDYSFTEVIAVKLTHDNEILVNGRKIIAIGVNRVNKEIYYHRNSDTLYRITYR
jgi:hypothetical protein